MLLNSIHHADSKGESVLSIEMSVHEMLIMRDAVECAIRHNQEFTIPRLAEVVRLYSDLEDFREAFNEAREKWRKEVFS